MGVETRENGGSLGRRKKTGGYFIMHRMGPPFWVSCLARSGSEQELSGNFLMHALIPVMLCVIFLSVVMIMEYWMTAAH